MSSGYHALSEKEKVTLRLLLDGHDAKSIARLSGLSVHTINERLRDARRKLAVSSSREAARLVRDRERADPQFVGASELGDAPPAGTAMIAASSLGPGNPAGVPRWAMGAAIMSVAAIITIALLASPAAPPAPASPAAATATATASPAATSGLAWLALVDAGDWQASHAATGKQFRALNTVKIWANVSEQVRVPLGSVRSRALLSEEDVPAPPGGYRMLRFKTSFAGKADSSETLTLVWEDGGWRVAGYMIG